MSFVGIAAGVSAISGAYTIAKGIKQDNLANKVVVPDASYDTNPYALKMVEEANRIKNARMAGAEEAESNIMGNQANAAGGIQRNATSGAQALAMLSATVANSDKAFNELRLQEGNDFWMKQQNSNMASGAMIEEGNKKYQDDVRKRQEAIGEKTALRGASTANIGGGINDVTNSAFMYALNGPQSTSLVPKKGDITRVRPGATVVKT